MRRKQTEIPNFIIEAANTGAGEGNRNDRAFWLAAQCRDSRVSKTRAEELLATFASRCSPPMAITEAHQALASAYRSEAREMPISQGKSKRFTVSDETIPWDGEIGPAKPQDSGIGNPDALEEVPAPTGTPEEELRKWLAALFRPEDKVNYVVKSFQDEDGKHKPLGYGFSRTRAEIEEALDRYEAKGKSGEELIRHAIGDWDHGAGAWARINPMDGEGCGNKNVTRLDHALVEGDEQSIERQLAVVKALRLPCAAIVHSGGKSIHAIVRVNAGTDKALYKERVELLFAKLTAAGFEPDVKCRNSSRLSRLPGPLRDGKPQYMVSGPCGAADWDEWISEQQESEFSGNVLTPSDLLVEPEPDSLVGERFLCRQGSWLLVAQSGIGKSVFAIQAAISFSVGRDLFGLKVERPLRNLMVQAENNAGDMHEAFSGITSGLNLATGEQKDLEANFRAVHCSRYAGAEFTRFVAHLCRAHKPDIVWIDPLLSYIGGEISKMQDTSRFLQNQLQPVIEDANCGLVVIHHTGKPPKSDEAKYKGHDLAYLGIGSSVLTNWARATSTLLRMDDNRFQLEHAKRGERSGCARKVDLRHAEDGKVCWLLADGAAPVNRGGRPRRNESIYDDLGIERMPPMAGPQPPKYVTAEAPVVLWVAKVLENAGTPKTPTQIFNLINKTLRDKFIVFDAQTKMWQGIMYDEGFIDVFS